MLSFQVTFDNISNFVQGVYITQDVGKQLLIEGTDNNLNRDWATIVSDIEEYETGIVASENYVFVTGRIWGLVSLFIQILNYLFISLQRPRNWNYSKNTKIRPLKSNISSVCFY